MAKPQFKIEYDPNSGVWNIKKSVKKYADPSEMSIYETWEFVESLGQCESLDDAVVKFNRWINGPATTKSETEAFFTASGERI